jgi:hypothetical protein
VTGAPQGPGFDRAAYLAIHTRAERMHAAGARLITIIARDDQDGTLELLYVYDHDGRIVDERFTVLPEWDIDSISDVYVGARNMERENVDLFGLRFRGQTSGLLLEAGKSPVSPLRKPPLDGLKEADGDG